MISFWKEELNERQRLRRFQQGIYAWIYSLFAGTRKRVDPYKLNAVTVTVSASSLVSVGSRSIQPYQSFTGQVFKLGAARVKYLYPGPFRHRDIRESKARGLGSP
jgi:hypothetical protein